MRSITRRRLGTIALAGAAGLAMPHIARAEQPLKMIVVVPPGASMDSVVRMVADKMPALLGRSAVVEYKVGGTGLVGGSFMKNTPPDGSYIMYTPIAAVAFFPFLYDSLPYDPDKDLAPVCEGAMAANALAVSNAIGVSTLAEYVDAVKRDPKLGSVGTSSLSSIGSFLLTLMRKSTGADFRLVAYRGGQPLLTDLAGNHVPAGQSILSDLLEGHRSGLTKLIGVTTEQRTKLAPDIPTLKEQGFADLYGQSSMGFFVRGGTSQTIISEYAEAFSKALAMPEIVDRMALLGMEARGGTPEAFGKLLQQERTRWEPVAREAGIRLS